MNIKELAEQAGWGQGESYDDCIACSPFDLEKFASLVAAHEREECAKLFESIQQDNTSLGGIHFLLHDTAKVIRARSKA
jgi:hypothetical protein